MMSDNNYDNWIVVQTRRVVFLNFLLLRFSYPQESLIKALVWSDSRPLINRGISKSIRHFIRHSTIQSSNHHTSTCFMINTIIQWEKFINFLSAAKQYAMLNIFYDGGCWQQNTKQCLQGFKYFCEIWWNILWGRLLALLECPSLELIGDERGLLACAAHPIQLNYSNFSCRFYMDIYDKSEVLKWNKFDKLLKFDLFHNLLIKGIVRKSMKVDNGFLKRRQSPL